MKTKNVTEKNMKVCLVGSSGGHLTHLYMLKPFWKDKNRFWVTFDKEDGSYNWTKAANYNGETLVTTVDRDLVKKFADEFLKIYNENK